MSNARELADLTSSDPSTDPNIDNGTLFIERLTNRVGINTASPATSLDVNGVISGTTILATTFDTNVAAAGVTLSGTTLAADGTNPNIDINIAPKGTGVLSVTKNVVAPDFEATSDRRVKENFRPLENALDLINQVKIHKYNLKSTGAEGIGVIAQELQEIIPEAVVEGETMSVHYNYLFSVLVQAVQELSKKVENGPTE